MCPHRPPCPSPDRPDHDAARTVAFHPEQGWSLLCNGVIVFDDMGEMLPGGRVVPPHRPAHVGAGSAVPGGVLDPDDLPCLDDLAPALREQGIAAVSQPVTASGAESTPAPAGLSL